MKFEKCEMIRILVTGEIGMIIDRYVQTDFSNSNYEPGYQVRLPNYSIHKFYEFELAKRHEDKEGPKWPEDPKMIDEADVKPTK